MSLFTRRKPDWPLLSIHPIFITRSFKPEMLNPYLITHSLFSCLRTDNDHLILVFQRSALSEKRALSPPAKQHHFPGCSSGHHFLGCTSQPHFPTKSASPPAEGSLRLILERFFIPAKRALRPGMIFASLASRHDICRHCVH